MVGRFSVKSALVGGVFAAMIVMGLPVVASVGDPIVLGVRNVGSAETEVQGSEVGPLVRFDNNNLDGRAARFEVRAGNAPFSVNSATRVRNLNADRLDGLHAKHFLLKDDYDSNRDGRVDDAETVMGLSPDDLAGQQGPEGPAGPKGDPADIYTFSVTVPVGQTVTLLAVGGWELTAACNADSMQVRQRNVAKPWKRASSNPIAAGAYSTRNTLGIVNGFGEGHIGAIQAWTDDGDVYVDTTDGIMAAIGNGTACVFAGAPHVQTSG